MRFGHFPNISKFPKILGLVVKGKFVKISKSLKILRK